MKFNEIADTGKTVILVRTASDGTDEDEHKRRSKDRPHPDFENALQAFGTHLRKILKLPKDWDLDIRKVAINNDSESDEPTAVTITGVHTIEDFNRPYNVNSPLLEIDSFPKLRDCVDTLNAEAELFYLRKKRVQLEIAAGEDEQPEGSLTEEQKEKAGGDWSDEESENTEEEPAAAATSANGDVPF
jgi:hypothetical protein